MLYSPRRRSFVFSVVSFEAKTHKITLVIIAQWLVSTSHLGRSFGGELWENHW